MSALPSFRPESRVRVAAHVVVPLLVLLARVPGLMAQSACAVGFTEAPGSPIYIGSPQGLAIGDLDGINGLDAAVGRNDSAVTVLLNDGTGRLAPSANPIAVPVLHQVLDIADFDGANGDDILIGLQSTRQQPWRVQVLYNDGAGGFSAGTPLALPSQSNDGFAADLDRRNGPDIVVSWSSGVSLFLADGAGGFLAPRVISARANAYPFVATGDFDGQTGPDLAFTEYMFPFMGEVRVLLNDGNGNFRAAPGSPHSTLGGPFRIATAELDGMPGDDIVYLDEHTPYTIEGLFNDGTGRVARSRVATMPSGTLPNGLRLADVDGSGRADVVITTFGQGMHVFLNDGAGAFQPSGEGEIGGVDYQGTFAIGDLDGQLGPDGVVITRTTVTVLHNAIATVGVPGENLFSVHTGGSSLLPPGIACPTLDLSSGGSFAFDVEGRAAGLLVVLALQRGACATLPSGVLPLSSILAGSGYTIPANCAVGGNQVFQLPPGGSPVVVIGPALAFDAARGVHTARLPFVLPASTGSGIVGAQGLVFDVSVPFGLVLTNAIDLRY